MKQQKNLPFSKDSNKYNAHRVGTLRDATIVDTTGAGDAFIGGYIMSLVAQNLPFDHCISFGRDESENVRALTLFRLRFASWVAGKKLAGPGGQSSLPSGTDVDECLGLTYDDVRSRLEEVISSPVLSGEAPRCT